MGEGRGEGLWAGGVTAAPAPDSHRPPVEHRSTRMEHRVIRPERPETAAGRFSTLARLHGIRTGLQVERPDFHPFPIGRKVTLGRIEVAHQ